MATRTIDNIKLGTFVLGGLLFLVMLLYMIGKNRNLFGDTYVLKSRFENIQGLVPGNNVRYSGIQAGTVKKLTILDDTLIEVTMIIDTKMKKVIRTNSVVSIGTDGFVGNKVVNISPAHAPAALAVENDILASKKAVNTDDMLQTLSRTNSDISVISAELKSTVLRINASKALWALLNDEEIPGSIRRSVANIRIATARADKMVDNLLLIVKDIKNGKGSVGAMLRDTALVQNLNQAILKIQAVGGEADSLALELNNMVSGIQDDVNRGQGTIHALLKDSAMTKKINNSLDNIQQGTDGFNQNMEALKHNFLFKGYFKKLEKSKQKKANQSLKAVSN
jgi:phospholipid/cholesterol/gamma-HCH transport system substrate-binding protein